MSRSKRPLLVRLFGDGQLCSLAEFGSSLWSSSWSSAQQQAQGSSKHVAEQMDLMVSPPRERPSAWFLEPLFAGRCLLVGTRLTRQKRGDAFPLALAQFVASDHPDTKHSPDACAIPDVDSA